MYRALDGREYQKRCLYSLSHRFWQSFISIEFSETVYRHLHHPAKTINWFLRLLIVFLKSKTHQLNLKDVIKLNRNLPVTDRDKIVAGDPH